jgi:hypothetical protein
MLSFRFKDKYKLIYSFEMLIISIFFRRKYNYLGCFMEGKVKRMKVEENNDQ